MDCKDCGHFVAFRKRKDEVTEFRCYADGWEGYIIDTRNPPCGGLRFNKKGIFTLKANSGAEHNGRHYGKEKH